MHSHSQSRDLNLGHSKHKALNCNIQWSDDDNEEKEDEDEDGRCDDKMIRLESATIMKLVMTKRDRHDDYSNKEDYDDYVKDGSSDSMGDHCSTNGENNGYCHDINKLLSCLSVVICMINWTENNPN